MVKINFIQPDGSTVEVDAKIGGTVMEAAVNNSVRGIDADCGGACACATCHVYVSHEWKDKLQAAEVMESDMLEYAHEPDEYSRLSCQLRITPEMEGLVVRVPSQQS
ncbi:2Fe-2S iron-sulfur cluster binding domain-containing protein [Pseudomonas putida]|uniref:2Fe-2S iron-sulfur cluster-binding protein n=1 Tax=Pseudomonas putida TaxID=303 RepID=UPI001F523853|nr:2Fe-2S iron-sulfur cluster-binding protein [Pseudomonas putida]MCI1025972.1 2Fe-2S iron-sulfur cluster binding domain-containing protein [Pseudomonas putida]